MMQKCFSIVQRSGKDKIFEGWTYEHEVFLYNDNRRIAHTNYFTDGRIWIIIGSHGAVLETLLVKDWL